jgi:hypothetical protein
VIIVAYYIAVETTIDEFEAINVKKTNTFKKVFPDDSKPYECSLDEIDKYTVEYNEQKNFSDDLYDSKLIPWSYYARNFAIICDNEQGARKVLGDILFSSSKKYIENPSLVTKYIMDKAQAKDVVFLKQLSSILEDTSMGTYLASRLANFMDKKQEFSDAAIKKIAELLIQNYSLTDNGSLDFSVLVNYERFHNTVAFISEYENKLEKNKPYTRTRKPQ